LVADTQRSGYLPFSQSEFSNERNQYYFQNGPKWMPTSHNLLINQIRKDSTGCFAMQFNQRPVNAPPLLGCARHVPHKAIEFMGMPEFAARAVQAADLQLNSPFVELTLSY